MIKPRLHAPDIELRSMIPNLLTTISLCSGLASLHFSVRADWDRALAAIAVAAIFDALDGRAARLLRVSSNFGAVLDSLSDFLSFGVAPAMLVHQWMRRGDAPLRSPASAPDTGWDIFILIAAMTYALCAALRLARFTAAPSRAKPGSPLSHFFVGMPSPAAAGAVLIPVMLEQSRTFGDTLRTPPWAIGAYAIFIGLLMISRLPMFAFKKLRVKRHLVVPSLVIVGLLVFVVVKDAWLAASTLAGLYLLSLPLSIGAYRKAKTAARGQEPAGAVTVV